MATDPLESVISNVPDWLKRLEELNTQIEQRQKELAKFSGVQPPASSARSIRNRGSTESLKPPDDGPALPTPDPTTDQPPKPINTAISPQTPDAPVAAPMGPQPAINSCERARATVRKRQKTDSMLSAEGTTPKYRTRKMVMVYYDSYVQSFFEELVKFVSAQRNLMRKAKMAAKVAHIRRLAELEMPEDEDDDEGGELKPGNELIAAGPVMPTANSRQVGGEEERRLPQYLTTRPYGGGLRSPALGLMPGRGMRTSALNGGLGVFNEKGDIWDELDKGLEFVQGMCERAAHQFLRDGDCNEEIEKIKNRLVQVKETAVREKERTSAEQTKNEIQPEPKPGPKLDAAQDPNHTAEPESNLGAVPEPNHSVVPEPSHGVVPEPNHNSIPEAVQEKPEPKHELVPETTRYPAPETGPVKSRTFRPSSMRRDFGALTPSKISAREGQLEIDEGIDVDMDDFKPVYRSTRLMRRPV
ncbi:hypothetical protein NUW58_g6560 [Xylaria curta]|uniref:Uncharacterized protein n=1 Tax=Xylaria curta TaxID=42375 RepID=A0ACC1NSP5_9PEZI|nr:hypothetical protein NUW58_g6560 [Xylaria curta]